MKFTQPKLPYAPDALAPAISQRTIEYHWGKHEKGYIDTLNSLIEGTEFDSMSLDEIVCRADGKIFNNASQAWNHIFYFFKFNPEGQKAPGADLLKAIENQFGSFEKFKETFEDAGKTLFGAGWVWLSSDSEGNVIITQGGNAENPMRLGLKPILTVDVWEHAYYLDYQNLRADYLKKMWDIIDWSVIDHRYANPDVESLS